jgi:hypothetical protein
MNPRHLVVSLFVTFSALAQFPDFQPPTPLLGATLQNNTEAVKKQLADGANPNADRFFGWPALSLAVMQANHPMAVAMLEHGADLHAIDANGNTPLMWAIGQEKPQPALVQELLARGANPRALNKMGESAWTWAMRRGDLATIARLKKAGATDASAIRTAVERAIKPLQTSGPQFVKVSGCTSCHHQSLPQIVNGLARTRGFALDEAAAAQQVKAVMAMFKPVREKLLAGTMTPPNPAISVGYSLWGLAAEGYAPDQTTAAMVASIARTQLPGGSFAVLPVRPPMESSVFTATALGLRSLQLYGQDQAARVAQAREWLERSTPVTNEDKAMRLMGLVWAEASPAVLAQAAEGLLADQRADGGWAQLATLETDAYATGQALTALAMAGGVPGPAQQRAVAYLLRTQLDDGTWLVRTRSNPVQPLKDSGFPHGRDQWISAAGTSWAAMALTWPQPALEPVATENQ